MSKSVVLKFEGDFETEGFRVTLEVRSPEGKTLLEKQGDLPENPALAQHLRYHWQEKYRSLAAPYRIKPQAIIRQGSIPERIKDCQTSAQTLSIHISQWLEADSFRLIDKRLREELNKEEEIRVLIRTDNADLHKLPLHLWDFFESYKKAEIALSPVEIEAVKDSKNNPIHSRVRILVILGHSEGIDIEKDLKIIQSLPNCDSVVLVEPEHKEINDKLWEQPWDIIFFAGHSETEGETGRIYINPQDSLTIEELWFGLRKSVEKGLKLAIFNSCDGLGLARKLDDLNIPQMIVMRELVPDRVAQEFLKHFLTNFAQGQPFYLAVREARERLHDDFEREFPCASWLPVICQNPAYSPPSWEDLAGNKANFFGFNTQKKPGLSQKKYRFWRWKLPNIFLSAITITGMIWGVRSLGGLQAWELKAYDHLMQMQPDEGLDERLLLVTITENDVQSQPPEERKGYSLSERSLALLVEKLEQYQPRVIGLHLFRETALDPQYKILSDRLKNSDRFFVICRYGDLETPGVSPPPEVPLQRQGFSNILVDADGIIRRNLLSVGAASSCQTRFSLSWKLAERYLVDDQIFSETTSEGKLKLGKMIFNILEQGSGAYQAGLDWRGHQIMLNYRRTQQIARQVTLSEVLADQVKPEWVRDRIIIVGITASSFNDHHWLTPYSYHYQPLQKTTGIEIQAQMVSQILSSVLDDQPLIWWFPDWGEAIFILSWSIIGGMIVINVRSPQVFIITTGTILIALYVSCWGVFLQGGWIPFVPSALALVATGSTVYLKTNANYSSKISPEQSKIRQLQQGDHCQL
ncbi:CHASE2 domain-containing protein [Limnoraphis robusta]|uniref:CHASE2 domain-containing protein n=1 Tax=Limnoraphis robusta TaxID=1118279 RepID=UPI002B211510|nr:CHASE2 domain-containing protein [Limnoraphis robusta]MEA5500539.1 CHASE2 domain-containing protein [Limnoraphis robusta BA-68 BA1]